MIRSEGMILRGPYAGQSYEVLRPAELPGWMTVCLDDQRNLPVIRDVRSEDLENL